MDQEDLDLEQRVWARIGDIGPDCEEKSGMEMMLRMNEESAYVYRQLAARSSGSRREKLMGLHRQTVSAVQTLRGMLMLEAETPGRSGVVPCQDSTTRALAKAFRRSSQLYKDYVNEETHAQYGGVFEILARQEAENMTTLLELLGE